MRIEAPSKPLEDSEQASELSPAKKHHGQPILANHESIIAVQPRIRSFHLPTQSFETTKLSSILNRWLRPILTMRCNQVHISQGQFFSEIIAVSCFVIEQSALRRQLHHRTVEQSFDVSRFVMVGGSDHSSQRSLVTVHQNQDVSAGPLVALADHLPPFFARQNVPSAIRCSQSTRPSSSLSSTSRDQTSVKIPVSVHSRNRRRQVDSEGKVFGKSFQGPPFLNIQSSASSTARGCIGGRPPTRVGGCQSKRSSIRNHWLSESCDRSSVLDAASCRSSDG